jgi:hypothetical protein
MRLEDIIDVWNSQEGEHCDWDDLGKNEMVEFALSYAESEARSALDDLSLAVYFPHLSSITVDHAINHVNQVFSTETQEEVKK